MVRTNVLHLIHSTCNVNWTFISGFVDVLRKVQLNAMHNWKCAAYWNIYGKYKITHTDICANKPGEQKSTCVVC